jgi:hypothetical protein
MTDQPWTEAVRQAGADPPPDLASAVREELKDLWSDLDQARHYALRGGWSMACDWIVTRIVRLSRLAGATPWQEVPIPLMLDGTYVGVLATAGIAFERPGPEDVTAMRGWAAVQHG